MIVGPEPPNEPGVPLTPFTVLNSLPIVGNSQMILPSLAAYARMIPSFPPVRIAPGTAVAPAFCPVLQVGGAWPPRPPPPPRPAASGQPAGRGTFVYQTRSPVV